ncbi:hypothetical protein ACGFIY_32695 [Micromonospora chersina]|uniref:hypothetical protein n=1 Tax=Micromonospora chersina TaxID=47854 RepID=UPI00371100A6
MTTWQSRHRIHRLLLAAVQPRRLLGDAEALLGESLGDRAAEDADLLRGGQAFVVNYPIDQVSVEARPIRRRCWIGQRLGGHGRLVVSIARHAQNPVDRRPHLFSLVQREAQHRRCSLDHELHHRLDRVGVLFQVDLQPLRPVPLIAA